MVELEPVDAVEVTFDHDQLVAEHGFSALVTVERDGRRSSVLYDGGMTPGGLANNLAVMEVDPAGLRAIVISHGHVDHHGGLEGLAARGGRRRLRRPGRRPLRPRPLHRLEATHRLAQAFPDAFIQPSVGTVFRF